MDFWITITLVSLKISVSLISTLLPAALIWRDLRHHDRRTTEHESITTKVLLAWMICGVVTTAFLWKESWDASVGKIHLENVTMRLSNTTSRLDEVVTGNTALQVSNAVLYAGLESHLAKWQIQINGLVLPTDKNLFRLALPLPSSNRIFRIIASNIGDIGVERVAVSFACLQATTNVFWPDKQWIPEPTGAGEAFVGWVDENQTHHMFKLPSEDSATLPDQQMYQIISNFPIAPNGDGFTCPRIEIRPTMDQSLRYQIQISVASANSRRTTATCLIRFPQENEQAHIESASFEKF